MLTLGPGPGDLGSDARRCCHIFSDIRRRDDFWKDMLGNLEAGQNDVHVRQIAHVVLAELPLEPTLLHMAP